MIIGRSWGRKGLRLKSPEKSRSNWPEVNQETAKLLGKEARVLEEGNCWEDVGNQQPW